jgi:hypothetical protein
MAYATFDEFAARYPTRLGEAEVTSHFLAPAAQRLEAMLAGWFSAPFSDNNLTAKDLCIDLAQVLLMQRSKDPQDWRPLAAHLERRVADLRDGREAMITASGEAIHRIPHGSIWSSTQEFKPVFDLRGAEAQRVDPDQIDDEERRDR